MHDSLWTAATHHRFLGAVRDGTITDASFDRWLAQDASFVGALLTFQARLLARAPRPAQAVLAGGCVALVAELDWFEEQAGRRGIDLAQPALPATLAYLELLARLDAEPVDAALTALWVLERVYLLAGRPPPRPLRRSDSSSSTGRRPASPTTSTVLVRWRPQTTTRPWCATC
ncbi:TenA family transcriptional regulator [Mycolicibacterium sp. 050158]|uniref:TenA family transcriptional regulator n=1 Tax=Mycolicibacterium sp. 050158 TaxID=3090602 RepID=UPI00299CF062|nr:TenA family transcriptional regulator [Mycolicibacterium sp. 050158]MDX1891487.1 TenA family transcriptional regulator [Mycolicibacterium sp. 050158]